MNPQMQTQEQLATTAKSEMAPNERDLLAQWGFTAEQITSLLWLRQWYQTGGSDRAVMVCYLKFLKLLVHSGELELYTTNALPGVNS